MVDAFRVLACGGTVTQSRSRVLWIILLNILAACYWIVSCLGPACVSGTQSAVLFATVTRLSLTELACPIKSIHGLIWNSQLAEYRAMTKVFG